MEDTVKLLIIYVGICWACTCLASVGSRQRLRSATPRDLVISPTVSYFGAQSFAIAVLAWNQLPADIYVIDLRINFLKVL